ncbi:MAG TPA: alginate export family protein [Verrucomicrobiae bacterium]|nr:alginate export family protein [Verrucomicrobiae bacterium]
MSNSRHGLIQIKDEIQKTSQNIEMINTKATLSAGAIVLAAINHVYAQYVPPPPPAPFAGFLNEYLRTNDPAMNAWDFGGSARARFEAKEGFAIQGVPGSMDFRDQGGDQHNEYFLERIRYHGGYIGDWWGAFVEGQSSLVQADKRFAYADSPAVPGTIKTRGDGPEADIAMLHQAFVTVGDLKEFPLALKIGRQEMSYGDERLIGTFSWNNIGRTFDAAKLTLSTEWFSADFFTSRPVIPEDGRFNVANDYDWFSGVYATTALLPKNNLQLYFLSRNSSSSAIDAEPRPQFPQPSARDIYTVGGRLKSLPGQFGSWDYTVEGAYQFGDFRDNRLGANSPRLAQSAFMAVANVGYTFTNIWATPRLAGEYSYSSGDSNPHDGVHGTFDNLFPTTHRFNGYMNFFSFQNVQDARGILQLKPCPRMTAAIEGHGFWLADTHDNFYNASFAPRGGLGTTPGTGYGINPNYGSFVGTELDAIAGFAVTRFAQLEMGYGHFFVGDYIKQSLSAPGFGSRDADWAYMQATITF